MTTLFRYIKSYFLGFLEGDRDLIALSKKYVWISIFSFEVVDENGSDSRMGCGLSIHLGSYESRKTFERKFTFQIGILNPHVINERFSFN